MKRSRYVLVSVPERSATHMASAQVSSVTAEQAVIDQIIA